MPITTATSEEIALRSRALGQSLAWASVGTTNMAEDIWPVIMKQAMKASNGPGGIAALADSVYPAGHGVLDRIVFDLSQKYKAVAKMATELTLDMLTTVTDSGDYWTTGTFKSGSGKVVPKDIGLNYIAEQVWKVNYSSDIAQLAVVEALLDVDAAMDTVKATNNLSALAKVKQKFVGKVTNDAATILSKAHLVAAENYAKHMDRTATDEHGNPATASSVSVHGHGIVAWRRVTEPGACEYCMIASTQRYHTSQLRPLHLHCRCTVAPVVGTRDPGHVLNRDLLRQLKAGQYQEIKRRQLAADTAYKQAQQVAAAGGDLTQVVDKLALKSLHEQLMSFAASNPSLDDMAKQQITQTVHAFTGAGIAPDPTQQKGWHYQRIQELIQAHPKKLPTPSELGATLGNPKKHGESVAKRLAESKLKPTSAVTSALTRDERMLPPKLTFAEEMERLRGVIRKEFGAHDLHNDVKTRLFPRVGSTRTPTRNEIAALRAYQDTSFYADSNLFLRLGGNNATDFGRSTMRSRGVVANETFQRRIRTLDKACRTDVLKEPTMLFRGIRGSDPDGEPRQFHDAWDSGKKEVVHHGFLSTSFNPGVAKESFAGRDVIAIRGKAGLPGSRPNPHTGSFTFEQEYLLGRGGKFTIIDREEMHDSEGKKWYIWHCDYEPGNLLFEVGK